MHFRCMLKVVSHKNNILYCEEQKEILFHNIDFLFFIPKFPFPVRNAIIGTLFIQESQGKWNYQCNISENSISLFSPSFREENAIHTDYIYMYVFLIDRLKCMNFLSAEGEMVEEEEENMYLQIDTSEKTVNRRSQ